MSCSEFVADDVWKRIYLVRGYQVMLDSDLAELYQVQTKALNQVVRRHPESFPVDFYFQLDENEYNEVKKQRIALEPHRNILRSQTVTLETAQDPLQKALSTPHSALRSQTVTLESSMGKHRKYLPKVFTVAGVVSISALLKSPRSRQFNVTIIRSFTALQKKRSFEKSKIEADLAAHLKANLEQLLDSKLTGHLKSISNLLEQRLATYSTTQSTPTQKLLSDPTQEQALQRQRYLSVQDESTHFTLQAIQEGVCHHFKLKISELKGTRRSRQITLPRQIATYLVRKHTQLSLQQIGDAFGGRNHSTVLNACRKISRELEKKRSIRNTVSALEKTLALNSEGTPHQSSA